MEGLVSPQGRVDVVGQGDLDDLVVILVVEPSWIPRKANGHDGIHEARTYTNVVCDIKMYSNITRGRHSIPTTCRNLKISIDILGSL